MDSGGDDGVFVVLCVEGSFLRSDFFVGLSSD